MNRTTDIHIPCATYRLQLCADFGFARVAEIIPYLSKLGITDIYASPIFAARSGSTHGYDVTDPNRLNPVLGSPADFNRMLETLKHHKMGWLQDIVPNHMAYCPDNDLLMQVLEQGPDSPWAHYFDILWDHPDPECTHRLLAPVLGETLETVLENGELSLTFTPHGFCLEYFDWSFPLSLVSICGLLDDILAALESADPDLLNRLRLFRAVYAELAPAPLDMDARSRLMKARQTLAALYKDNPAFHDALDGLLRKINRDTAPDARLVELCREQHYTPAHWKTASEKINYRRFFYLNDFIALRPEDSDVFEYTHRLIRHLVDQGVFTGLRVDHIDGLLRPSQYLHRLRKLAPQAYILVEKILEPDESLPEPWPIQGSTGYEFANALTGVLCRTGSRDIFRRGYTAFIGRDMDPDTLLYEKKKDILLDYMRGEVNNLARFAHLCESLHTRDAEALEFALVSLIAAFGVYRTYTEDAPPRIEDRRRIEAAVNDARARTPEYTDLLDELGRLLCPEPFPPDESPHARFILAFQQLTGPAMAKGFEDTFLYIYNPLTALNEVGGAPQNFGLSLDDFHTFNLHRQGQRPHALSASATHDTKRNDDVRARLAVLSEIPEDWFAAVHRWSAMNAGKKSAHPSGPSPDANDEYLLYQSMLGALPLLEGDRETFPARIHACMQKAVREAKVHTRWIDPDPDYENTLDTFIDRLFAPGPDNAFYADFLAFHRRIAFYGILNSLSQLALKLTCPGVPDTHQGTDLWRFSLVDPDNRRPVNYAKRQKLLDALIREHDENPAGLITSLTADLSHSRAKVFVLHRLLFLRRHRPELFRDARYIPLLARGVCAESVIAFLREYRGRFLLVAVPRFLTGLVEPPHLPLGESVWKNTVLTVPAGLHPKTWRSAFDGSALPSAAEIPLAECLSTFPLGVYTSVD